MRWRGLAQSPGTVPPISQRPLRRSTTYQGQERARRPGRDRITGGSGSSPCRGSGFPLCQRAGVSPKPGGAKYFLSRWRRAFLPPDNRGFPQAEWLQVFPSPVAQSFLLITQLGVSPPPYNLKLSLCRVVPGFPPGARGPKRLPNTAGAGLPRGQRPQSMPITRWFGVSPAPVAPGFPRGQRP